VFGNIIPFAATDPHQPGTLELAEF